MGSGASAVGENREVSPHDLQDVFEKIFKAYDADGDGIVSVSEFVEAEAIVAEAKGESVDTNQIMSTYFELSLSGDVSCEVFEPWIADELAESASNQREILMCAEERIQQVWIGRCGPLSQLNIGRLGKVLSFQGYIDGAENRAISLKQLQKVFQTAKQQCKYWRDLAPTELSKTSGQVLEIDSLNLYHLNEWLIRPCTKQPRCSLVEMMCSEPQPPEWFVSHWWGEPIVSFLQCVSSHSSLRQLPDANTYWACAYANCQHALQEDISDDPAQTSFVRALQRAKYKVLLVLDEKNEHSGPATPFLRIWCALEEVLCLNHVDSQLDVAASQISGQAALLTTGLTRKEESLETALAGSGFCSKTERESLFPLEIVEAGLAFDITQARSSVPEDRVHILNFLVGETDLNREPYTMHPMYDENSLRLRSYFARSFIRRTLAGYGSKDKELAKKSTELFQKIVCALTDDQWESTLTLDLRGTVIDDFGLSVMQLPPKLDTAQMYLAHCTNVTDSGILFFSCNLPDTLTSLDLGSLDGTQVTPEARALCIDLEGIQKLASILTVIITGVDEGLLPKEVERDEGEEEEEAPKRAYKAQTKEGVCVKVSSDSDLRILQSLLAESKEEGEGPCKVVGQIRRSNDSDLEPGMYIRTGSLKVKYDWEEERVMKEDPLEEEGVIKEDP